MQSAKRLFILGILLAAAALAGSQFPQPPSADPQAEVKRIEGMISAAARAIREAGRSADAAPNPAALQQIGDLWEYGRRYADTRAGAKATAGAVQLLTVLKLDAEARNKTDNVAPQEPAWQWLPDILLDQARRTGDYSYMIQRMQAVLGAASDPARQSQLQLALGLALAAAGRRLEAERALQLAIEKAPGSRQAEMAELHLHDLRNLNLGQPAPGFTAAGVSGEKISLTDLRGKIVLLDFWASF